MFGPATWEIKLRKTFISASEFVIVFLCKVQFVSHRPVNSHLMHIVPSPTNALFIKLGEV